jgi:hypothetical protein
MAALPGQPRDKPPRRQQGVPKSNANGACWSQQIVFTSSFRHLSAMQICISADKMKGHLGVLLLELTPPVWSARNGVSWVLATNGTVNARSTVAAHLIENL